MSEPLPSVSLQLLERTMITTSVSAATVDRIVREGILVELAVRDPIYAPDVAMTAVYFPITCVLSVINHMQDGSEIEIGTIGREGTSAFPILLGAGSSANHCYTQVPGLAIKISVDLFYELSLSDMRFRQLLDRYLQSYVNMLGQLAACNRLHSIFERASRWLLISQDRVESNDIRLTQEFLAMMLGTSRSGIAIAASTLGQAGFIKYAYGIITIVDRPGLESCACECYLVARQQFAGLVRTNTQPSSPYSRFAQGAASKPRNGLSLLDADDELL